MKTFYLLFLSSIFSLSLNAQLPYIIQSADSLCQGESVMLEAFPGMNELRTPTATNNHNGYMFDVTATYDAIIEGFLINPVSSGGTYYVYYRTGSHVGHENTPSGWMLIDSATNVPSGAFIDPGFKVGKPIVAGQTLAFYITSKGAYYTQYGSGTAVGNTLASDAYLTIKEGVGKAYLFGTTYTPRTFVGAIQYTPGIDSYAWNTGKSTATISETPNRSSIYACEIGLANGIIIRTSTIVHVNELKVAINAVPSTIQSGESSTLSAEITLERGISSEVNGSNNLNGAMFDLSVSDSVEIDGFTISTLITDGTADLEIMYKAGTHVGYETNSSVWTSLATFTGITEREGNYLPLNNPLLMIPGQTVAFYITRTDGDRLYYSNGTSVGASVMSANGLTLHEGAGISFPFGNVYSPRVIDGIVHFTTRKVNSASYNWSVGGTSGAIIVFPTTTSDYTVDVSYNGCSATDSVTVYVGGVGIELKKALFTVYPNPASTWLHIACEMDFRPTTMILMNMTGQVVFQSAMPASSSVHNIPLEGFAKGLYLLQLLDEDIWVNTKVEIM